MDSIELQNPETGLVETYEVRKITPEAQALLDRTAEEMLAVFQAQFEFENDRETLKKYLARSLEKDVTKLELLEMIPVLKRLAKKHPNDAETLFVTGVVHGFVGRPHELSTYLRRSYDAGDRYREAIKDHFLSPTLVGILAKEGKADLSEIHIIANFRTEMSELVEERLVDKNGESIKVLRNLLQEMFAAIEKGVREGTIK